MKVQKMMKKLLSSFLFLNAWCMASQNEQVEKKNAAQHAQQQTPVSHVSLQNDIRREAQVQQEGWVLCSLLLT